MAAATSPRYSIALTPRSRAALLILTLAGLAAWLPLRRPRHYCPGSLGVDPQRLAAAAERIDPNTASAASLRRLPGIGKMRAQDIVAYRREHGPGAFASAADLDAVYNIGPATVERIAPYLSLPADSEGRE
jgi:competence ComEA-like helix-hairpin-helix protein